MGGRALKAFCLNLDTRPDRWQQAQKEFAAQGLQVERFPAIVKSNPALSFNASQVAILRSITTHTFVFEDDVQFINVQMWDDILLNAPTEFDILYLGGNVLKATKDQFNDYWWRCTETWTTHAVIYSPKGAARIFSMWQNKGIVYDEFLRQIQPKIKAYICKPFLAIQRPGYSDLMKTETDYTEFFKQAESRLL